MARAVLLSFSFLCSYILFAQKGNNTYEFLNLPNSARIGALGGANISIHDDDLNIAYTNPALLTDTMNNSLALNYINYFSDINFGYVAYARSYENIGTFSVGVQNINYGEFNYYDDIGNTDGSTFGAKEYAIALSYGRALNKHFSVGINLKQVISVFERYQSYGIVGDIGLNYYSAKAGFSGSFVLRNMGSQITTYTDNNYERMPFEVMFGVSQKLQHAPFRFSVTGRHLQDFDLTYVLPKESTGSLDDTAPKTPNFANKMLRHAVIGVEFLPFKNFYLAAGYNPMRRYELAISDRKSTVGWSWGFGIKVYKFNVSYGSARYHLSATSNHFSITTNLSAF